MRAARSSDQLWEGYASELGINLSRAREQSGLSQEHLAHAAGISTYTYRKLEKGESNPGTPANPRLRTLAALAGALGLGLNDLLPADLPDVTDGR